jgi:hypothetical protein
VDTGTIQQNKIAFPVLHLVLHVLMLLLVQTVTFWFPLTIYLVANANLVFSHV